MARTGYSDLHDSLMGAGDAFVQAQNQRNQQQQQIQNFILQEKLKQQFAQQEFQRNMDNYNKYAPIFNNPGGQSQPMQPQQPQQQMPGPMDLSRALMQGQMPQQQQGQQMQQQPMQQQSPMVLNPASAFSGKFSMMKNPNAQSQARASNPDVIAKQQDYLEKQYVDRINKVISNRTGGLGTQDAKVNQAIHLRTLLDQYYDPQTKQYNVPASQYEELAIGLANLVSGSNAATESMINGIRQRTATGDMAGAYGYITGKTPPASSQDVFKNLADSIDRQGMISENLRNRYLENLGNQYPTRLSPDAKKRILGTSNANSYKETLSMSPAYQSGMDVSSQDSLPMQGDQPKNIGRISGKTKSGLSYSISQ